MSLFYMVGLSLPNGAIHHLTHLSAKQVQMWAPRVSECLAWAAVQNSWELVFNEGEIEVDAARMSIARNQGRNRHLGRFFIIVHRNTGEYGMYWLPPAVVSKGAPPPPEKYDEVLPILRRMTNKSHLVLSDGSQGARTACLYLGNAQLSVNHAIKQFSRMSRLFAEDLPPELQAHAHKQIFKRPSGPAKASCPPMLPFCGAPSQQLAWATSARTPSYTLRRPAGSRTVKKKPVMLVQASTNLAEARIGVLRGRMRLRGKHGHGQTNPIAVDRETFASAYLIKHPGVDGVLKAVGDYTTFFTDMGPPSKFL